MLVVDARRASRRRRSPTSTWRMEPTWTSSRSSTRSTCPAPTREGGAGDRGRHRPAAEDVILASAKEGIGTQEILEAIVERVPPPKGDPGQPLRALIFDSNYDAYKGVIAYVRVMDGGCARAASASEMMQTGSEADVLEVGDFSPDLGRRRAWSPARWATSPPA